MRGSDPLDQDPAAQNGSLHILITSVRAGSGGQDSLAGVVAARVAGDGVPAAGLRRRTPISVFRGLIRLESWPGLAHASCVVHWWH